MSDRQSDTHERSRDELLDRIEELQRKLAVERSGYSRRSVIAAAVGVAAAGAAGVYATTAEAAPTGTFPKGTEDPLLKIRADRVRLVGRTSDPSSPGDGTMWYRGDL